MSANTNHDVGQVLERASRKVVGVACAIVLLVTGLVLVGWLLADSWIIHFPIEPRYGTMMPWTAVALLLCTSALWLQGREDHISRRTRLSASLLAAVPILLSMLLLWEYIEGVDFGIDGLLFPETIDALIARLPRRPAPGTAFSFIALGSALLCIDVKSKTVQRICDVLILLVILLALERGVSILYREMGGWTPRSRTLGMPLFQMMPPAAALSFASLAFGWLFARLERREGLVALFYSPGPARLLARWLVPLAIIGPVLFGWLGMLVFRAGLRGTVYPRSLVVSGMIVLFMIVISLSARAIGRADRRRKRAEAALAERERLQHAVFDNAGAGLVVVDVTGKPVATNKTLQAMLGYSADEMATMPFWRFTHPRDETRNRRLFEQLVRGEIDSYFMETRCPRKDGTQFAGELNTSVAHDAAGQPEFVIGMLQDVTERKEAEEARQRLDDIVEATPDFVGITDPRGNAVYVNHAGRRLTGFQNEEIRRLRIADFHTPEDADRVTREGIPAAIRDGVWTGETQLKSRDGKLIPVSQVILAHKTQHGELAYLSTIMRDITYRKRLELAQQFLLDISRASTGSMDTGTILRSLVSLVVPRHADYCVIYLMAPDGCVKQAAFARVSRTKRSIAELLRVYSHPKKPMALVADVARSGDIVVMPHVSDTELTLLLGGTRHIALARKIGLSSIMAFPLRGRERILGVICYMRTDPGKPFEDHRVALAREMAARVALALDNADLLWQAQEATRIRDEVLRVVAHDLRNPLNTISLTADFLHQLPAIAEQQDWAHKLEVITRSVAHADRLIQDLLDVARLEAGLLTVETSPTDAARLVEEVLQMLQPHAAQRGIRLRSEIAPDLDAMEADASRVVQVLSNLLRNAVKFSGDGAEVVLRVVADDGKLRFSIHDHGPGIAEEHRAHLFDPFWQARKSKEGVGLGLPIAKAIVQAHGGSLWFESERGVGSTFYFTLPVVSEGPHSLAAD